MMFMSKCCRCGAQFVISELIYVLYFETRIATTVPKKWLYRSRISWQFSKGTRNCKIVVVMVLELHIGIPGGQERQYLFAEHKMF